MNRIEKIRLPIIHAQVGNKIIGPFYTTAEASRHFGLNVEAAATSIKSNRKIRNIKFFTDGIKEFIFNEPNVVEAKREGLMLRATNFNPHNESSLLHNLKICGFENPIILKFDGVKSTVQVDCCNVECDEIVNKRNYNHLTQTTHFLAPRCEKCKGLYKAYSALNRESKAV
ncbi:hypothetical protein OWP16_04605 [Bacillus paranthracis]|uniref:hypothetical protein n=1 Tax=Bacillus paranthracis TaxID=2026186 RepID=UPI002549CA5A|nr:hypothetical protein [Bacillus paranthracis]MDK7419267.1 hypothetical protein [Bacillus paranthracis]MDK7430868.1 hypothetical protein [Bacillus paranthracis]MDK7516567.1 hypothetical protein [Bacillus paranthracis]MDK7572401.1 hypothetical protein [Bacillus paranthracis]